MDDDHDDLSDSEDKTHTIDDLPDNQAELLAEFERRRRVS